MRILKSFTPQLLLIFFLILTVSHLQAQRFKVALDAGHGGKDHGAVYSGHIEKNIALGVVLKVGKILEATPGMEVIYTRKTDIFIDLVERANIANKADANIFVSIHCNANKNTVAAGTETYVMGMSKNASNLEVAKKENSVVTLEKDYKQKYGGFDPNSPESVIAIGLQQEEYLDNSISLASKIQDIFTDALGRKNRGVKQAPFMVLHKAYMPRVLIEMGFISNPSEGNYLGSEEGQNQMARSIADAIISYRKEYFGSGTSQPEVRPSQKVVEPVITPTPDPDAEPVQVATKPATKPAVESPVTETPAPAASVSGVVYKVQLAVISNKLDPSPANFKGLSPISMAATGTLYRYMYGSAPTYEQAKAQLAEAKAKYPEAFIIAFKDGRKISVQEALALSGR
jgi:N-acetylmuramoyl-L-alanine amidase